MNKNLLLVFVLLFTINFFSQNCGEHFYDSGGIDGDYSNGENTITTICPDNIGDVVIVDFESFNLETNFDFLRVYDGDNISAPLLREITSSYYTIESTLINGGCLTFEFISDQSISRAGWEANITCEKRCEVTNVDTDDIATTWLVLSWVDSIHDSSSTQNIEYGVSGFVQGTGNIINSSSPATISGLNSNAEYDFYIQTECSSTTNLWSGPFTFSTLCSGSLIYPPYFEDFENNGLVPSCWENGYDNQEKWLFENDVTVPGHIGDAGNVENNTLSRGYFTYIDHSTLGNNQNAGLRTSPFALIDMTNPILSFYYISDNEFFFDYGNVNFSVIMYGESYDDFETIFTSNTNTDGWEKVVIDLTPYLGFQKSFLFKVNNYQGDKDDLAIDNIYIGEMPTCNYIDSTTSVMDANSVTISVNDTNSSTSSWEIEYGESGFVQGTGSMLNSVVNPLTITGLSSHTSYEYYIRANCSSDNLSVWNGPFEFETAFVAPYYQDFDSQNEIPMFWKSKEPIEWHFDNEDALPFFNAFSLSGNNCTNIVDGFYNGPSNELITPYVEIANLINPTVSFYLNKNDGIYLHVEVWNGSQWIEIFGSGNSRVDTHGWEKMVFDLSAITFSVDATKVRFKAREFQDDGRIEIDDFYIGEAECDNISKVTILETTIDSVIVSFLEGESLSESIHIEYGEEGFIQGTGISLTTTSNPYVFSGLQVNRIYDVYCQLECSNGEEGNVFGPFKIQTDHQAPYNQNFDNSTELPMDWIQEGVDDWTVSEHSILEERNSFRKSGGNSLFIQGNDTSQYKIINLPIVDVSTLSNPVLSFFYNKERSNLSIEVWNGTQWENLYYISNDPSGKWVKKVIDLSSLSLSSAKIRFKARAVSGTLMKIEIDDVYIGEEQCTDLNVYSVYNMLEDNVTIDLSGGNSVNMIEVEYGEKDFVQGTGILVNFNANPFILSNLQIGTAYDVYYRTDCFATGQGMGNWFGPINFHTAFQAPFYESFTDSVDYWNALNVDFTNSYLSEGTTYSNENYCDNDYYNATLITPNIDISTIANAELSFYYYALDGFLVEVWNGTNWITILDIPNASSEWIPFNFDLSTLSITDLTSIKFSGKFKLDDVRVDNSENCYPVFSEVNIVTNSSQSVTVNWLDNMDGATDYTIEVYKNDVFLWSGVVSSNTYTFSNVEAYSTYKFYISANCNSEYNVSTTLVGNYPYIVEHVPFKMYNQASIDETFNSDDAYSPLINLGFGFNYFGLDYSILSVGTNSVTSFDVDDANSYCNFRINNDDIIPNANVIDNAILGAYQDFDNRSSGMQWYNLMGTAPFRKFLVSFDYVPLFSMSFNPCVIKNSNQIILYETFNYIDVQIRDRNVCSSWNDGNAIVGIQSVDGQYAYFPPNRNTGDWEAHNEGWRFKPVNNTPDFQYILCDANADNTETFDLNTIYSHFGNGTTNTYATFETKEDAENDINSISTATYTNTTNAQTIFVKELTVSSDISIKRVLLAVIDCTADYDLDTIATTDEDLNSNGNYGDDDTDGDQIPNFLDDDDGDYVLTTVEAVETTTKNNANTTSYLDTDGDLTPNYLDNDDDGDGILSLNEDINSNYNPLDDDTDGDNIPDYLDNAVLSVNDYQMEFFKIYPNPTNEMLTVKINEVHLNTVVKIFTIHGQEVYSKKTDNDMLEINVSELSNGMYFINVLTNNHTYIKKFIKE